MSITPELFLAILSMDAYNRDYGAGIEGLGGEGSQIGTATLLKDSHILVDESGGRLDIASGFYAIAYDTPDGTVISYRGTDNDPDYIRGWVMGAGLETIWTQADEALAFYSAVKEKNPTENTIVVGHSLGGGLAGFVSVLTGTEGYGFDYMPFGVAAWAYKESHKDLSIELNFNKFNSMSVKNEILESLRDGSIQLSISTIFSALSGVFGATVNPSMLSVLLSEAMAAFGLSEAESTVYFELLIPSIQKKFLESHSEVTALELIDRALKLHMQDYLVNLRFAEENKNYYENWTVVGKDFFNAYFDVEIAKAAGAEHLQGKAEIEGKMGRAIAYSVLEEGQLVFGDAGVRAMFNDLDDLGKIYKQEDHDAFLDAHVTQLDTALPLPELATIRSLLVRTAVEYAGALALNKVTRSGVKQQIDGVDVEKGVVAVSDDATTLALDLSSVLWGDVLKTGTAGAERVKAVDADILLANFFLQSTNLSSSLDWLLTSTKDESLALDTLAQAVWEANDRSVIDRLHFRALSDVTEVTLADRSYDIAESSGENVHVDLYAGTDKNDSVTGTSGNDMLCSGDGDDEIVTQGGRDLIVAGNGSDKIIDRINIDGEKSPDPSETAHDDVFVGGRMEKGLRASFMEWLRNFVDTDSVEYSAESVTSPGTPCDKGVKITKIETTSFLDTEALALSLCNGNNNVEETDLLVGIEKVILTNRSDEIRVSDSMLSAPLLIDMGDAAEGTSFTKDDYDKVSYEDLSKGIVLVNGATQTGMANENVSDVGYLKIIADIAGSIAGVPLPVQAVINAFESNDPLRVVGAEDITLTNHDDTVWFGHIGGGTGALSGWPSGDDYPHFGEIDAGGGNDVVIVRNPEYVSAGTALDPSNPESAKAGTDLRLEVNGGSGDDRIIVTGGEGAVTIGGAGRDFIYNTSYKGQLYGDSIDGTGGEDSDVFWWSSGAFIMDAGKNDILQMYGIPLTGGTTFFGGGQVRDWMVPFVTYGMTKTGQLLVSLGNCDPSESEDSLLSHSMIVQNYTSGGFKSDSTMWLPERGDLGMTFRITTFDERIGSGKVKLEGAFTKMMGIVWGELVARLEAMMAFAKMIQWKPADDPLVLDLDGDGIETSSRDDSTAHFDLDGDYFAEKTSWVGSDDGLLVMDRDGNGAIDDISELFGAPGGSGFTELAKLDTNGDGSIDAGDADFLRLQVWRDLNQDGISGAGELFTLADLGITGISLQTTVLDVETPSGNHLRAQATFDRHRVRGAVQHQSHRQPLSRRQRHCQMEWRRRGARLWPPDRPVGGHGQRPACEQGDYRRPGRHDHTRPRSAACAGGSAVRRLGGNPDDHPRTHRRAGRHR